MQDLFIHLTNYAVQKKKKKGKPERELEEDEMDEDDEQQEEGNNLSMAELNDFLLEEGYPMGCDGVVQRIHEVLILKITLSRSLSRSLALSLSLSLSLHVCIEGQ